jgi:RHS repeat-associated protein
VLNVVERYHYSPYGEVTILNGASDADPGVSEWSIDADQTSDIGNEFLFTGRRLDPVTGLYQYRERYYHPQMGYAGGMNLYAYVGGMPTGFVDPFGLVEKEPNAGGSWGEDGWWWLNPWSYPILGNAVSYGTGYYDSVDKLKATEEKIRARDDTRLRIGSGDNWDGTRTSDAASDAKVVIKELGRDVAVETAMFAATGGLGGGAGKADDVIDAVGDARKEFKKSGFFRSIYRFFAGNPKKALNATDAQIGKKFGQHMNANRSGYRTHLEYRERAAEILNDANAVVTVYASDAVHYAGETHYQLGDELLRLDPDGFFRSLYPIEELRK